MVGGRWCSCCSHHGGHEPYTKKEGVARYICQWKSCFKGVREREREAGRMSRGGRERRGDEGEERRGQDRRAEETTGDEKGVENRIHNTHL